MKKINLLFTAILLLCCVGTAKAVEVTIDGIKYDVIAKQAKVISGDTKYSGNIVIPSKIKYKIITCSVTSIGERAFEGCYGLTSVTIPNSVTSIGERAFEGCYGLTSVVIGNGVTSIGERAFEGCYGLTSVVIGNGVTSIGWNAFQGCSGLISITIPNSVTSIGNGAFYGTAWYNNQPDGVVYAGNVLYEYKGTMPSNTSVVVKDGTLGVAEGAFYGCSGLTSITIPNSVTSIGDMAFFYCLGLTSITIPNSVTSIGERAFEGCSGLTSIVVEVGNRKYDSRENCNAIIETESNTLIAGCMSTIIPNSVTSIGYGAFYSCSGLTSITIPNSVTSIGVGAFSGCSGLTSITIPNSVTSIGVGAFSGCSGLTSITIPNSVTSIGNNAFYGCTGLTSIVIEVGNKKYDSRENCNAIIETESNTLIAGCMNTVIPNSVTSIGEYAFSYCWLTSIEIPNSVTSIGDRAFSYCWLTSIEIPNSVTSIGNGAFYNCSGLTSVTIGNGVTSIGYDAFYNCSGLTSVTIGNGVTSIGYDAFGFCHNLSDVFCLATDMPSTRSSAFDYSYPENITLHVPAEAINSYKTTLPWSSFGNIVEITDTGIIDIPAKAVLVTSNNGTINITCSLEGESVELYTSDAMFIESTTIENGCATIESGLSKGDIAIVKIGEKSIKIIID